MNKPLISIVFCALTFAEANAFVSPQQYHTQSSRQTTCSASGYSDIDDTAPITMERRIILQSALLGLFLSLLPACSVAETKAHSEEYRQGTAALADMDSAAPVPRESYKKLDSGVIIADLFKGGSDAAAVKEGSKVNMEWVLRKSNGYFVDSSKVVGIPFIFTVGDGSAIKGVDQGVRGMKVGGVRRLLIPPSLAYVDGLEDGKPGPLPVGFGPRQQMRR
jgi:hypothetical protein